MTRGELDETAVNNDVLPTCPRSRKNKAPLPLFDIFKKENQRQRRELRGKEEIRGLIKPDITFFQGSLYCEDAARSVVQSARAIIVVGSGLGVPPFSK